MPQENWFWCGKCQGLFFAGNNVSVCPAGGQHQNPGGDGYVLQFARADVVGWDDLKQGSQSFGVRGNSSSNHGVIGVAAQPTGPFGDPDYLPEAARLEAGVAGYSDSGSGVVGASDQARGIWGVSPGFIGTAGDSTTGSGVLGHSQSGPGVYAVSDNFRGIEAHGKPAGHFEGDVEISNGQLTAGNADFGGDVNFEKDVRISYGQLYAGNVHFGGDINVVGDVILGGQDCAEDFDTPEPSECTPGTVVVLDDEGAIKASHEEYDRRVAGVVSGAGAFRPGIVLGREPAPGKRVPLALVGRVCCKVDASQASIDVGDLLTTSSTAGHAMRASDPSRAFGAVIGKALAPLPEGRGLVPILVALQ
jgi:hypothetical protein